MPLPANWGLSPSANALTVKVITEDRFKEYEGFDIASLEDGYEDIPCRPLYFYVPRTENFGNFRKVMAEHLNLTSPDLVRFWRFNKGTSREFEEIEITEANLRRPIEHVCRDISSSSAAFGLYLEVATERSADSDTGSSAHNSVLIFLKYFDIPKQRYYGVGTIRVGSDDKISELFERINGRLGWRPAKKLWLCEELNSSTRTLQPWRSFSSNSMRNGDIICFHEQLTGTERELMTIRYPELVLNLDQFFEEMRDSSLRKMRMTSSPQVPSRIVKFETNEEESFSDALKRLQERMGVLNKDLTSYSFTCVPKGDQSVNAVSNFRSLMNCTICLDILVDPVTFADCMHMTCGSCAVGWFRHSNVCHQCRQPVRSIHDNHTTAAIVEAYCQLNTLEARTSNDIASLRAVYRPGQFISIDRSDSEADETNETESVREEVTREFSAYGCPCCNPGNPFDFLCSEPILSDDESAMFPGHTRCADCDGHLPLIPESSSDCCALCTRLTCHELGMDCGAPTASFSLQPLKNVRFPKKLDSSLLRLIPIEREREILMTYAKQNRIGAQSLFERILASHQGRGLPRARWHGAGQAPFDPTLVRTNDIVCFSCARELLASAILEWRLYSDIGPVLAGERPACQYGISCVDALEDVAHARLYNHMSMPAAGNDLFSLRGSIGATEGGIRLESDQADLEHRNTLRFDPSDVQFRDKSGDPVFLCSAVIESEGGPTSTIPGKVTLREGRGVVHYIEDEDEMRHHGAIRLLLDTRNMRWVRTSGGNVPAGSRPVLGGLDFRRGQAARELYHCAAWSHGERVPGYISREMKFAHVASGGETLRVSDNYELLCWV